MHLAFTKKIYYIIRACLIYKRKHIRLLIKSHDHVIIIQVIYVLVHQSVLFIQICQLPYVRQYKHSYNHKKLPMMVS